MTEAKRSKSIPPRNTAQAIYNQMHAAQVGALQATCEHAFSPVTSVCVRWSIPLAYAESRAAKLFAFIQSTKSDQTNPMTCLCGGKLKSEGRGPAPGDAVARHSEIACEGYNQWGWARIVGPAATPPVQTSIDGTLVRELMQDTREQALIDFKFKSRFSAPGRKWLDPQIERGETNAKSCDAYTGKNGVRYPDYVHPRNLRGKVNVPALALEDLDDLLCEVK